MSGFASEEYNSCKQWIAEKIQNGSSWETVRFLCVTKENFSDEFNRLQNEELIIPQNMDPSDWIKLVDEYSGALVPIVEMFGLSKDGNINTLAVPTDSGSAWVRYKNYLLGKYDSKQKMAQGAVSLVEQNCHWILNHMRRDTRESGPIKGLVMGSVQSGKTANMMGLVSMAAHYDWNFFVILSGTIDNLRKQTRDRFTTDLLASKGVSWHVLDYCHNSDYLAEVSDGTRYLSDDLSLNTFQDGKSKGNWMHRYVTVCLKNSTRLKNLIDWLHANPAKAAKLRILIIDDEADQASLNTRKMIGQPDEDEIERTAVNQLIIDLANGRNSDGSLTRAPFQAINYISFTATPYANVLNEAYESSLYPKDFICSLPESNEYFGAKVIFGSATDENYPGLDIVRNVPRTELTDLKLLHSGEAFILPDEFKKAVCWFLCAAAVLRVKNHRKPISMLVHTTALQNGHFKEYKVLREWLREGNTGSIIKNCEVLYAEEIKCFSLDDLRKGFLQYGCLDEVDGTFPPFSEIRGEIVSLLSCVDNIMMGEDNSLSYHEDGIHLCVDNCKAGRAAEDGTYLRIVYPSNEQLSSMKKAPVFIVMGGNTLSRGLTIEGLTCTYFARNSNQADTLMQMARWFGYRKNYELLQRIWLPLDVQAKFELLEKIDEKLKSEFEDFMIKGRSPAQFGPRITNSATIARFLVTSKNKAQNAEPCSFDFSGDSYETTKFSDDDNLKKNIVLTENFLKTLGNAEQSKATDSAYVWYNIDSEKVEEDFIKQFYISDSSSLFSDIPVFLQWLRSMNEKGLYLKWNVAVSGDKKADATWTIGSANIGKIERSKKKKPAYIDIGSLRSGRDALCDVAVGSLSEVQKKLFNETMKSGKNIISARGSLNLNDKPLLLLYCIDKDKGKESKLRTTVGSCADIIGFAIIVAGDPTGASHVTMLTVKFPDNG